MSKQFRNTFINLFWTKSFKKLFPTGLLHRHSNNQSGQSVMNNTSMTNRKLTNSQPNDHPQEDRNLI